MLFKPFGKELHFVDKISMWCARMWLQFTYSLSNKKNRVQLEFIATHSMDVANFSFIVRLVVIINRSTEFTAALFKFQNTLSLQVLHSILSLVC